MAFFLLLAKEPKPGACECVSANGSRQAAATPCLLGMALKQNWAGEVASDQTRQPEGWGRRGKKGFYFSIQRLKGFQLMNSTDNTKLRLLRAVLGLCLENTQI